MAALRPPILWLTIGKAETSIFLVSTPNSPWPKTLTPGLFMRWAWDDGKTETFATLPPVAADFCCVTAALTTARALETYYRIEEIWPQKPGPIHWQLSPDFQDIRNPGYNRDRGPVHFWAIRFHVEY
jgi:hypothetical protein